MVKGSSLVAKVTKKLTSKDTLKAEQVLMKKITEVKTARVVVKKLEAQLRILENLDISEIAEIYTDDLELDESLVDED